VIKTASSLGVKFYRLGEISYDDSVGIMATLQKVKEDFRKLAALNRKYNIHGALQNHVGTRVGSAVWDIYEILKILTLNSLVVNMMYAMLLQKVAVPGRMGSNLLILGQMYGYQRF